MRLTFQLGGYSSACRAGLALAVLLAGSGWAHAEQVIERIVEEVSGMRRRAQEFEDNPELVRNIVAEGADKAREAARETLDDVRRAMHLRVG
jgi:tryptophanyl-tRNA synthetase